MLLGDLPEVVQPSSVYVLQRLFCLSAVGIAYKH